jgi:hypothetical protein
MAKKITLNKCKITATNADSMAVNSRTQEQTQHKKESN